MREVASQSRRSIVLGVLAALGWTVAKIAIPLLALQAVDGASIPTTAARSCAGRSPSSVVTLFVGAFTAYRRYAAFAISLRAEAELRRRLFDHLQRLHFGYHDRAQIGELMARVSTDAKQVQMLLVFIPVAGANVVMVARRRRRALRAQRQARASCRSRRSRSARVAATRFSRRLHPVATELQERLADVSHVVEESVSGIRVVKGFGAEACRERAASAVAADGVYDRAHGAWPVCGPPSTRCSRSCRRSGSSPCCSSGGREVIAGDLSVGDAHRVQLLHPAARLPAADDVVHGRAAVARRRRRRSRVYEILATEPEIIERPDARAACRSGGGEVRFEGVTFGYRSGRAGAARPRPRRSRPGESVALVGADRLGQVDGRPAGAPLLRRRRRARAASTASTSATCGSSDLRDAVGIVFEDTFLFTDTVRANIAFADDDVVRRRTSSGRPASPGGHDFVTELPDGYDTVLGEHGLLALGWPAPARRDRPGHPRRPRGADPRRRHLVGRPHQGARDPRRARPR